MIPSRKARMKGLFVELTLFGNWFNFYNIGFKFSTS